MGLIMKFKKINISNCLVINKLGNNSIIFNKDNVNIIGNFSRYCMGITYSINKSKKINLEKFSNIIRKDNYHYNGLRYKNEIYDIIAEKIEQNTVYSYFLFFSTTQEIFSGEDDNLIKMFEQKKILFMDKKKIFTEIENVSKKKGSWGHEHFSAKENLKYAESDYNDFVRIYNEIKNSTVKNKSEINQYASETEEKYFLFNDELYYCDTRKEPYRYTQEQLELLLKESIYKENAKFEKLKKQINIFEKYTNETENIRKREPISEDVRFEVWRRDSGKCVLCGSNENLEFDHIIPFSKGGSSTARNIQLLCENCNRKKSNKI